MFQRQNRLFCTEGSELSWPEELLSTDIPEARIAEYGYDADVFSLGRPNAHIRIGEYAQDLVTDLTNWRNTTKTSDRPLIWVAHSFGGLLCEDALLASKDSVESNRQQLLNCTRAIAFFGTPHCGADLSKWALWSSRIIGLLKKPNGNLLKVLQPTSEVLARIQTNFHSMLRARVRKAEPEIKIACYYEQLGVPGVGLIVPQHSAILPSYVYIGIHSNHIDMTKFKDKNDLGYKRVVGQLRNWVYELRSTQIARMPWEIKRTETERPISMFAIPPEWPFANGLRFVGRQIEISEIHRYFSQHVENKPCVIGLVGIGGIGKSQIALRYAQIYSMKYTAIFWIDASSIKSLEYSFMNASQHVVDWLSSRYGQGTGAKYFSVMVLLDAYGKIPEKPQIYQQVIRAMMEWLAQEKNDHWLLIFDNYDDIESFNITKYFPQKVTGRILVTSRRTDCRRTVLHSIPIGELDNNSALTLLLHDYECNEEHDIAACDVAESIVRQMHYFPLAIDQANAYIVSRKISLVRFFELYERKFKEVMGRRPRGQWTYQETVFSTFEISFEAIECENPASAGLLLLCSFFDNEMICDDFLQFGQGWSDDDCLLEDALEPILSYSLARRMAGEGFIWIHPIVHTWARERLNSHDRSERSRDALNHLWLAMTHFGGSKIPNVPIKIARHVHAYVLHGVAFISASQIDLDIFRLLEYMTRVVAAQHNPKHTGLLCLKALDLSRAFPDLSEQTILGFWRTLTQQLHFVRYHSLAAKIQLALKSRIERAFGLEDVTTLTHLSIIGISLVLSGEHAEAEGFLRDAIKGLEKSRLTCENMDICIAKSHLALCLMSQGKLQEAEALGKDAFLRMLRAKDLSPDMFVIGQSLAIILQTQHKTSEADGIFRMIIPNMEILNGMEHPNTIDCKFRYAQNLILQSEFAPAEKMLKEVLETSEAVHGYQAALTLDILLNKAVVAQYQEKYDEAERFSRRAVRGKGKISPHGADMLTMKYVLATSCILVDKKSEGVALLQDVCHQSRALPKQNHELISAITMLISTTKALSCLEVREIFRRSVQRRRSQQNLQGF